MSVLNRGIVNSVPSDLISTKQAAEIIGCHPATVKRYAVAGELPVVQQMPGRTGARLFRRSAVERFAKKLAAERERTAARARARRGEVSSDGDRSPGS